MAYAATVTITDIAPQGGHKAKLISIAEAETAATSEWSAAIGWAEYTIVSYRATLTAGTGTTVNPRLGRATGWTASTQDDVGTNVTTAAHIDDPTKLYVVAGPTLYGVSQVSAAADNVVATEIIVLAGLAV